MQTIVYSTHLSENHKLIADRIRKDKPEIYLLEAIEPFNPILDIFLQNKKMTFEQLVEEIEKIGYFFEDDSIEEVLYAARDVGAKIIAVEDENLTRDYLIYSNEVVGPLVTGLFTALPLYLAATASQVLEKQGKNIDAIMRILGVSDKQKVIDDTEKVVKDEKKVVKDIKEDESPATILKDEKKAIKDTKQVIKDEL